jgi:hypothetical protein
MAFASGLRRASNHAARVYCVDTWQNDAMSEGRRDTRAAFLANTARYADAIIPVRGASTEVAPEVIRRVGRIDLLFIDGDHSYAGCLGDWNAYAPYMSRGGRVAFHDVGWAEGVQRVIAEEASRVARPTGRLPNLWWGELP